MNNEKVYIEGYVVGFIEDTTGTREKRIQVSSGEIVSIDESFIHKLITPEKVKIPQFVADWLSNLKSGLFGLNYDSVPSEIYDWVYAAENNLKKLHLAIVFGYEVEKEKRYRVKFIQTGQHIAKNIYPSGEYFVIKTSAISSTDSFTRKELEESGFGWVFDCPGIEIEEV